ncbi:hypothetical protein CYLTODRAFT_418979 [Cylindrobasidium torrendii FP15055 ss-10]|uniref:Uncharacterized protein n=1 Tax=Cylindrobasidium torrendii FP15055 ss-10 TaxID=1314674 RepID=A0A0D7BL70_9AGAR|nr:hypothetical protein CYLTODRAFT_418979 [Cylindrobasidium torrendii FP15055 ss-10]
MAPTTTTTATTNSNSLEAKDKRAGQRLHRKQHYHYKDEPLHPRIRSTGRPTDLSADLKDTDTPSWMDQDVLMLGWDTLLLPLDEDMGGDCYEWDDTVGFTEMSLGDIMRSEGCKVRSARRTYHRKGKDLDSFEVVPKVAAVIALEDSEPSLRTTTDKLEGWDLVEGEESAEEGRGLTYAQVVTG